MHMDTIWNYNAILEARTAAGMTQTVAAKFLKITPEYLSMLENGKKQPSQGLVGKMADLYSVSVAGFLSPEKVKLSA